MKKDSLSALLRSVPADDNIIIGRLLQHRIREQAKQELWPIKDFHASQLATCERKQVLKILHWEKAESNFPPQLLDIFDNGNFTHKRIQRDIVNAGLAAPRGTWKIPMKKKNGKWVENIEPEFRQWAVEVPIKYPKWLLKGTMDVVVLIKNAGDEKATKGKYYLIEIKSMNDFEFKVLRAPKPEHYTQGQAYIVAAEEELKIEVEGVVFLYENKNTQARKEFVCKRDDAYIKKLGMKLIKLKKYVQGETRNSLPPRENTKSSKPCQECDMRKVCWESES